MASSSRRVFKPAGTGGVPHEGLPKHRPLKACATREAGGDVNSKTAVPSFSTLLRLHRRRMGLTQEALGERAGFSVEYIKKLEGGSRRPSASAVDVLGVALDLEPPDFEVFRTARIPRKPGLDGSALVDVTARAQSGGTAKDLQASDPAMAPSTVQGSVADPEVSGFTSADASGSSRSHLVQHERRLVTALFCEIDGFSDLDESFDAEDVGDVQGTLLAAVGRQVGLYGGTIEGHASGEILALFGVHKAHEDDPERAILCALGMQDAVVGAVAGLDEGLKSRLAQAPTVRVCVNTGEVVLVPRSDTGVDEPGVSGDGIDGAVRLRGYAGSGEILVAQPTMHLTRRRVRYGAPRELSLVGRAAPVLVFPALGLSQSTEGLWEAVREILPPATFVGRKREMETLNDLWEHALAGEGQLVSIVGEPGIGKSRLIAEFVSQVTVDADARLVTGRCLSYGQEVSLWLIADLVRSLFSLDEEATPDDIGVRLDVAIPAELTAEDEATRLEARDVLGEVLGLPASESVVAGAGAEVRRNSLVRMLQRVLEALSARGPTILVLQDLHWIDTASEEILGRLVLGFPSLRLLALVARREGWSAPWNDLGWPERIALRRLPEEDASALASTVMGNARLSSEVVSYLAERAGGNPFFVEELSRFLKESGGLHRHDECLYLVPDVTQGLPATLAEVLQARLDHLDAPAKALAQVASVIGRTFAIRLLAEVVGDDQSTLEQPLRALQQAEIAFPRGYPSGASSVGLEYSFKHVTLSEVAYNTLVRKRRQDLHLKTARAIAALYRSDEYIETIAYHYFRTDAESEAAEWFEKAGDRAAGIYANDSAEVHYRNAIDRLAKSDGGDGLPRVREKLADLLLARSSYDQALGLYQEALAGIAPTDRIRLARIHRKIGGVWAAQRSFLNEALAAWDVAEAALGERSGHRDAAWWREWLDIQLDRMQQFYFHQLIDELTKVSDLTGPVIEVYGTPRQRGGFFQTLVLLDLRRDAYTPTERTLVYARKAVDAAEALRDVGQLGPASSPSRIHAAVVRGFG